MPAALFVYGSLAPGEPNEYILTEIGGTWAKASVRGFLYKRGWGAKLGFYGIVPDPKGDPVQGYLFSSDNLENHWQRLDAFEGEEYQRVIVSVDLEDGNEVEAYIYQVGMPKVYIETERLLLRQFTDADKPLMQEMQTDPAWMEHFPFTRSCAESDQLVDRLAKEIDDLGFGFFAVEMKETGEFIGFIGLHVPDWNPPMGPCVEVGWGLRRAWWGMGYVTEAAKASLDYAKDKLGLKEVLSFTIPANKKSIAVMERIGMSRVRDGDFMHPNIDPESRFAQHVLYRIKF